MTVLLFRNLWILSHTGRTRKLFTSPSEGGGSRGSLGSVEQKYSCCSHKQRETAWAGLHCLGCCSVCHGWPDTLTATQQLFSEQGKQNGKCLKHVTTLMELLIWQPDSPPASKHQKKGLYHSLCFHLATVWLKQTHLKPICRGLQKLKIFFAFLSSFFPFSFLPYFSFLSILHVLSVNLQICQAWRSLH